MRPGRISSSTWNREVSLINQFYDWVVRQHYVAAVPIPHRARRPAPMGSVARAFGSSTVPATYAHDKNGERIEWMPPATYRLWRDVGLRGYGPDGLSSDRFRGRWAARNATFSDLMVRTGLQLIEQASSTPRERTAVKCRIPLWSG